MRRLASWLVVALWTAPAAAWEVTVEDGLCVLSHEGATLDLRLTFDPNIPLYTIDLAQETEWVPAPVFGIRFAHPVRELTITTDRHSLSQDRRSVAVSDSGFGNVLDGLETHLSATAILGDQAVTLPLTGAAPAVRAFRNCTATPTA